MRTSIGRSAVIKELDRAIVVDLPLRGQWFVERSPADRIPSHGTDAFGQRYAFDFIKTDDRAGLHLHPASDLRFYLIGVRTRECYGWGQPVYAAFDGEVVAAVDGIPEREWLHVATEQWAAIKNLVAFGRQGQALDRNRLAGNHVIVQGHDACALYAHLAPGSVTVAPREFVGVGEVVGRVGHTGSSTAPHLHFQLMDFVDPLRAAGIPCAFGDYLVRCGDRWERVQRGIPASGEHIRSF